MKNGLPRELCYFRKVIHAGFQVISPPHYSFQGSPCLWAEEKDGDSNMSHRRRQQASTHKNYPSHVVPQKNLPALPSQKSSLPRLGLPAVREELATKQFQEKETLLLLMLIAREGLSSISKYTNSVVYNDIIMMVSDLNSNKLFCDFFIVLHAVAVIHTLHLFYGVLPISILTYGRSSFHFCAAFLNQTMKYILYHSERLIYWHHLYKIAFPDPDILSFFLQEACYTVVYISRQHNRYRIYGPF